MKYNIIEYGDDVNVFMCSLLNGIYDEWSENIVWCGWSIYLNHIDDSGVYKKLGKELFSTIKNKNQLIIIERENLGKKESKRLWAEKNKQIKL